VAAEAWPAIMTEAFWKEYWQSLTDADARVGDTPQRRVHEQNVDTTDSVAKYSRSLLAAYRACASQAIKILADPSPEKLPIGGVFGLSWAAHTLCTIITSSTPSTVSSDFLRAIVFGSDFNWRHHLGCLVILESLCSGGLAPPANPASIHNGSPRTRSPFFAVLVWDCLAALHHLRNATSSYSASFHSQESIEAEQSCLWHLMESLLPDMMGRERYEQLRSNSGSSLNSNSREMLEESIRKWLAVFDSTDSVMVDIPATDYREFLDPLIKDYNTSVDESKTETASAVPYLESLLWADTDAKRTDIESYLQNHSKFRSDGDGAVSAVELLHYPLPPLEVPFPRPLPPPLLPLTDYEDDSLDDYGQSDASDLDDAAESKRKQELLDYLHSELIWLTPSTLRFMLMPDDDEVEDPVEDKRYLQGLDLLRNQAFVKPLAPADQRLVLQQLSGSTMQQPGQEPSTVRTDTGLRLIQESGLSPETLRRLVEHNPVIAYECLVHILTSAVEEARNEYLASLLDMDMSLHTLEVVNRLAMHGLSGSGGRASKPSSPMPKRPAWVQKEPAAARLLHPEYIHLFITRCIASCVNVPDRNAQNRLVRLVCVFVQSLLRHQIVEVDDIYIEVQSFCVEFSRIREASSLYKSLKGGV
jgi:CCR4-NOT transcription complex subunit 11